MVTKKTYAAKKPAGRSIVIPQLSEAEIAEREARENQPVPKEVVESARDELLEVLDLLNSIQCIGKLAFEADGCEGQYEALAIGTHHLALLAKQKVEQVDEALHWTAPKAEASHG